MRSLDRALGMLGLMARAGQIQSGESQSLALLRGGKAAMILLDQEASANTKKRFLDACAFRSVPWREMEEGCIGRSIGKPGRKVVALQAGSMANQFMALLMPDVEP